MIPTSPNSTVTFTHSYTEAKAPEYGTCTHDYLEQVLALGTKAFTQLDTYVLATGETSTYQADLLQMSSGQWYISTEFLDFTGSITASTEPTDPETAESWIRNRRLEHGRTV